MLNKIGVKELGTEKVLSVDVIDEQRFRFFLLNQALEQRMHIDVYQEEARLIHRLLDENLHWGEARGEREALPMLPAGEWAELSATQRSELRALADQLHTAVATFRLQHPGLMVNFRIQVEATGG